MALTLLLRGKCWLLKSLSISLMFTVPGSSGSLTASDNVSPSLASVFLIGLSSIPNAASEWHWGDLLHPVTLLETVIYGGKLWDRPGETTDSVMLKRGRKPRLRTFGKKSNGSGGSTALGTEIERNPENNELGGVGEGSGTTVRQGILDNIPLYGTRCYGSLGCLTIDTTWYHFLNRPVNVFPLERDVINTRFLLLTRSNFRRFQSISADKVETIVASSFDSSKPIKFIIHGFIDTGETTWVKRMGEAFLRREDCNAISVDWGGGSLPPYTQAAANVRLVALEIIYLIRMLQERFDVLPSQVHIVGHSLGAHTAAYVGQVIHGLARITGLDPSEPYFQGMPEFVRLDPGDAVFVDVVHTDANSIFLLGLGMSQPCGHLDFFPNGGKEQPGCRLTQLPLTLITAGVEEAGRDIVACNHQGGIKYFTESILTECPFLSYECDSYEDFLAGKCASCGSQGQRCAHMGYRADEYLHRRRKFVHLYTITDGRSPYCFYQYIVKVTLASTVQARSYMKGFLDISVEGSQGFLHMINLTQGNTAAVFEHGKSYSFVVTSKDYVGTIKEVNLHWKYYESYAEPSTYCFYVCNPNLYVRKVVISHYVKPPVTIVSADAPSRMFENVVSADAVSPSSDKMPQDTRETTGTWESGNAGGALVQGFCEMENEFIEIENQSFATLKGNDDCL